MTRLARRRAAPVVPLTAADLDLLTVPHWSAGCLLVRAVALVRERCGVGEHASPTDAQRLSPPLGAIVDRLAALGLDEFRCRLRVDPRRPVVPVRDEP